MKNQSTLIIIYKNHAKGRKAFIVLLSSAFLNGHRSYVRHLSFYQYKNYKSSHVDVEVVCIPTGKTHGYAIWMKWTHLVIEPVQVTERLQVFASESEAKAFT